MGTRTSPTPWSPSVYGQPSRRASPTPAAGHRREPNSPSVPSPLQSIIEHEIRAGGPITVARYIELALYHPDHGYYTGAEQRSGRAGDFFTSVDVGPLFGELLQVQLSEMRRICGGGQFDLVEAAAGNARLSRDILDAATDDPEFLRSMRLHLVERSARARARHAETLGRHAGLLAGSSDTLPARVHGVILANELLDALPPHLVVMREAGLRELFVDRGPTGLVTREMAPSSPALEEYLRQVSAELEPGWYAEVNLAARDWVRDASRRLERGFLLLIDYGHEAAVLYSAARAAGTLASFRSHASEDRAEGPGWLQEPGLRDITSHVDLTTVRRTATSEGLVPLGTLDQMYFLLGLGLEERLAGPESSPELTRRRLAAKTLLLPGGLGSTHKVMVFGKDVGRPALRGTGFGGRVT